VQADELCLILAYFLDAERVPCGIYDLLVVEALKVVLGCFEDRPDLDLQHN
jgi:hypothetical protein